MSVALDPVDLSAVAVGSMSPSPLSWAAEAGTTSPMAVRSGVAHLRLFNESGAGLKITFSNGASDRVPAGGWPTYELKSGQTSLSWQVEYLLPGAPVSQLLAVFYEPGEAVPDAPVLGNSPIGIGGSVTTSATSALKQDGSGPATSLIEATPSDQAASSWAMNNDGSGFIKVLSANVLRVFLQAVRGDAAATKAILTLGDAGDLSILTFYGLLHLINSDGGAIQSDGAGNWITALKTVLAGGAGGVTHADFKQTVAAGATAGEYAIVILHDGSLDIFDVTNNGTIMSGSKNVWQIFATLTATLAKINSDAGAITSDGAGTLSVTGPGGLVLRNSSGQNCHGLTRFSGTGSGTFSHGATATPTHFNVIDVTASSSMTVGAAGATGTTVVITNGVTGHSWDAQAFLQS